MARSGATRCRRPRRSKSPNTAANKTPKRSDGCFHFLRHGRRRQDLAVPVHERVLRPIVEEDPVVDAGAKREETVEALPPPGVELAFEIGNVHVPDLERA